MGPSNRRKTMTTLWIALLLFGQGEIVQSQEQEDPEPPQEPIVITATRTERSLGRLPFALELVDRSEIHAQGMDTVTEILRGLPGLHLTHNGTRGYNIGIFSRGTDSSHTLVLVDGFKVNQDGDNFQEYELLSPHSLGRIEFLRGPSSGVYGSGAIGGVIHMETLKGQGEPRVLTSLQVGSFATNRETILLTGEDRDLAYTISADRLEQSDGEFDHSDVDILGFSARLDFTFGSQADLKIISRHTHSTRDIYSNDAGPLIQPLDPNASAEEDLTLLGLEATLFPGDDVMVIVRASLYELDRLSRDEADSYDAWSSVFDTFYDRVTFEAEIVHQISKSVRLSAGAEHSEEDFVAEFPPFGSTPGDRKNTGVFGQIELDQEPFLATLTARIDDNDFFDHEETVRVAVAYLLDGETKVRASWGTALTTPAFLDLFGMFGNPDLLPEGSEGMDVGVDRTFLRGTLRLSLTGFYNSIKNLIQGFPPVNVGRARTRGIEVAGEYRPTKSPWTVRAGYTYLRATDEVADQDLIRRPRHSGRIGVGYDADGVEGWIDVVFVGSRDDTNFDTFLREKVDGFFKVDASGRWRLSEDVHLTARVENVLDEEYEEVRGFPGAGLNALIGIELGSQ
jgi:vitamin B12 transporter